MLLTNFKYLFIHSIRRKGVKMQKKGQFYIMAVVMISLIIFNLITVYNRSVVKPEPVKFYDLTRQLENEVTSVINYGVYSGTGAQSYINTFIPSFLDYAHEKDPNLGLIYIYGNQSYLEVVNYAKDNAGVFSETRRKTIIGGGASETSKVNIDFGGEQISKSVVEEKSIFGNIRAVFPHSSEIQINISDKTYRFVLKGQQYFFALLKSENGNETYYICAPECS